MEIKNFFKYLLLLITFVCVSNYCSAGVVTQQYIDDYNLQPQVKKPVIKKAIDVCHESFSEYHSHECETSEDGAIGWGINFLGTRVTGDFHFNDVNLGEEEECESQEKDDLYLGDDDVEYCGDFEEFADSIAENSAAAFDTKYTKNEGDPPNDCWPHPDDPSVSIGVSTYAENGAEFYVPDKDQTANCNGSNIPPNDDIAGNIEPPAPNACEDYYGGELCLETPETCEENGGCDSCGYVGFGEGGMASASYVCLRDPDSTDTNTSTDTGTEAGTDTGTDVTTDVETDTGTDTGTGSGSGSGTGTSVTVEAGEGVVNVDVDVNIDTAGIESALKANGNKTDRVNESVKALGDDLKSIDGSVKALGDGLESIDDSVGKMNTDLGGKLDNIAGGIGAINDKLDGLANPKSSIPRVKGHNPAAKSFYKSDYPDGFGSVFDGFKTQIEGTEAMAYVKTWDINISGGVDVFAGSQFCFDFGATMGNYGCHSILIDERVFPFIRILMLFMCSLMCRKMLMGG